MKSWFDQIFQVEAETWRFEDDQLKCAQQDFEKKNHFEPIQNFCLLPIPAPRDPHELKEQLIKNQMS